MRCLPGALSAVLPAVLFLAVAPGCAITTDLLFGALGPGESILLHGTARPAGDGPSTRKIALDSDHGLVCTYESSPELIGTDVTYETVFPSGLAPMTYTMTGLEAIIFVPGVIIGDKPFRSPYLLVPLGIDLAWGLYRSLTIKPEIRHYTYIYPGSGGSRTVQSSQPCESGTALVLVANGQSLRVHIGNAGQLRPEEIPALVALLEIASLSIRVEGDPLDLSIATEVIAAERKRKEREQAEAEATARARRAEAELQAAAPLGPIPGPPRRRASVYFPSYGPPQVRGVSIDFPLQAVCQSDRMCRPGQRCADRGDGVPLCFGLGALHPFCLAISDCAHGLYCSARPDGIGMCHR